MAKRNPNQPHLSDKRPSARDAVIDRWLTLAVVVIAGMLLIVIFSLIYLGWRNIQSDRARETAALLLLPAASSEEGPVVAQGDVPPPRQLSSSQTGTAPVLTQLSSEMASGPTFSASNEFGDGSLDTLVMGDVDGDGDLDIVAGDKGDQDKPGQNVIYLNDGVGNFYIGTVDCTMPPADVRCFGPDPDATESLAVGDMNGDGHLDIIVGNAHNVVYLNDGFGNFPTSLSASNARPFGPGTDSTIEMAIGDMNSDGHLDIVTGNDDLGLVVYLNDGYGNFPVNLSDPNVRLLGPDHGIQSLEIGDVDSDGDVDIVILTGLDQLPLGVYLNNGEGDFVDQAQIVSGMGSTSSMALGDVNGDGHLDIVVGREYSPSGSDQSIGQVYLNDGSGTFYLSDDIPGTEIDPDPVKAESLALGDMDGDGNLDLVMGKTGGGVGGVQSVLYLNDGKGDFPNSAIHNFGPRAGSTYNVVVADVDDDADLDIVTENVVYLSDGTDSFSDNNARAIGMADNVASVAVGDMDGDSHLDIITGLFNNGSSWVYRNNGNGNFSDSDARELGGYDNTYSVAVGDLDNDGDLDIVLGNVGVRGDSDNQNRIFLNDGFGKFSADFVNSNFIFDRNNTYSVVLADMDGDEDLDIITGNGSGESGVELSEQNIVYLNDGIIDHTQYSEFLMTPRYFGTGNDDTASLAVGDMDGDGDLDIVTGNVNQQNVVYLNDGKGNFPDSRNFGTGSDVTTGLAVGDVDGDGDLDIAAGNLREQNRVYLNDGAANFPFSRRFGDGADGTESVTLADVDGDDDLDIVTGNGSGYYRYSSRGEPNVIYLNDGNGNFSSSDAQTFGLAGGNTLSVAVGDLDKDGNLDIVTGNWAGGFYGEGRQSLIIQSHIRRPERLTNTPPYLTVTRPTITRNADFYSSPVLLDSSIIPFTYTLFDREGDAVGRVAAFYSMDGGGSWRPARATPDPVTPNLTTGRLTEYANPSTNPEAIPDTGIPFNSHLLITETYEIDELEVWLNIIHTNNADLAIALQSPAGTQVPLVAAGQATGQNFRGTRLSDLSSTTILSGSAPYTGTYRPVGNLGSFEGQTSNGTWTLVITDNAGGGSGTLVAWGVRIKTPPATYTYHWDTFASGFFGQSDDVVIRLVAYPQSLPGSTNDIYRYTNTVAGLYQWPYAAATTFPFRVRGTQVRVVDENGNPVSNARVYRNGIPRRFSTNEEGYLPGRGELVANDELVALQPITFTKSYTIYHTSARIDPELRPYVITSSGVQLLTTTAQNPLILFNLGVSLEWDARNDEIYRRELERNLRRASEILYDLSNGGIALGDVRVYQAKEHWQDANLVVYARNGVRPNADLGGFVEPGQVVPETIYINGQPMEVNDAYVAGQIRMGATWSRFGSTEGNLDEDWARALAHELSHYYLFLLDNYLGVEGDLVRPVECEGSAMSDPYRDDYSEFLPQKDWDNQVDCLLTLAEDITRRPDWETIIRFHSVLEPLKPESVTDNPGPKDLPLQVTQVRFIPPGIPTDLLPVPFFSLKDAASGGAIFPAGQAQGYLIKTQNNNDPTDDDIIPLGSPSQDLIHARGAAKGDEVCLFDSSHRPVRVGCKDVDIQSASSLLLDEVEFWPPQVTITPVTSRTFAITVTADAYYSDHPFHAQIVPDNRMAGSTSIIPLNRVEGGGDELVTYSQIFELGAPTLSGYARIWVDGRDSITQTIAGFSLHGEWPGPCWSRRCGKPWWAWWAPLYSADGGLGVYDRAQLLGGGATGYVQTLTTPPELDPWLTPVGQAYRVSTTIPLQQGSVLFSYLERDVPLDQEDWLDIYYYAPGEKQSWQRLATERDPMRNIAAARMLPEAEVYALMSTMPLPSFVPGWNNFGYATPITQSVTTALASIGDAYTCIYHYDVDNDKWTLYDRTVPPEFDGLNVNDLEELVFGYGYWIYATEPGTLYLPAAYAGQLGGELVLRAWLAQPQAVNLPTPPVTFYGEVASTGTFVPTAGMPVMAKIGEKECSEPSVVQRLGDGKLGYKLQVKPPDRCGAQGQTITFYVGGRKMDQEHEWNNSQAHYLPLSTGGTPGPGPGPSCDYDLIVNGIMENDEGWILDLGAVPARYVPDPRGSGRSLLVGQPSDTQLGRRFWSSARQTVILPVGQNAVLSLNYLLQADPWPGADDQFIAILDARGYIVRLWHIPLRHSGQWQAYSQDISQYAGQTIQVYVGTTNDGFGGVTQMFVDDVRLCIHS
jgi:subtilisin-like proprotein convertase family protein